MTLTIWISAVDRALRASKTGRDGLSIACRADGDVIAMGTDQHIDWRFATDKALMNRSVISSCALEVDARVRGCLLNRIGNLTQLCGRLKNNRVGGNGCLTSSSRAKLHTEANRMVSGGSRGVIGGVIGMQCTVYSTVMCVVGS